MTTPVPALPTLSGPYWRAEVRPDDWCERCGSDFVGQYWRGGDGSVFCRDCVDRKRGYVEP